VASVDPDDVPRLGVGGGERYATLQLVGKRQLFGVPELDVAEHGGDRPVLGHRSANLVLVRALDQPELIILSGSDQTRNYAGVDNGSSGMDAMCWGAELDNSEATINPWTELHGSRGLKSDI
jgi:hypothetical protein